MSVLAVVPARGGSKGIPGKNIVPLGGKPLIQYTLDVALKVDKIDRVLVSTDDERIAEVARQAGCDIPFLRPESMAGDNARTVDAVLHAVDELEARLEERYDTVVLLQPTSPFRSVSDLEEAIEMFQSTECGSVVSVELVDEPHPHKMKVVVDGCLRPFMEGTDSSVPRQELPSVYCLNGAMYISRVSDLKASGSFFAEPCFPFIMPWERSVNINGQRDMMLAHAVLDMFGCD
jgi:CMP-N-acetylneuraminic acid synthetase